MKDIVTVVSSIFLPALVKNLNLEKGPLIIFLFEIPI